MLEVFVDRVIVSEIVTVHVNIIHKSGDDDINEGKISPITLIRRIAIVSTLVPRHKQQGNY